jgi:multidrug efflux pump subunit AcrA (membrane-fusion protein)
MPNTQIKPVIEFRSEQVQEIVSAIPNWLVRWGITLFFIVLLLILFVSWLIHYPDLVSVPFRLTSENVPKSVVTRSETRILKVFVKENDLVQKDQILAFLESNANHNEVLKVADEIQIVTNLIENNSLERLPQIKLTNYNNLGELQTSFQTFYKTYTEFQSFLQNGFYVNQKTFLQNDLNALVKLQTNLQEQIVIQKQELQLAEKEFVIQQKLYIEKIIPISDFQKEESKLLSRQIPLKQIESNIINNFSLQNNKQREMLELDKLISEQKQDFLQSLYALQSSIIDWKRKFLLISPIQGKVFLPNFIQEKQLLRANYEVFFIGEENNNSNYYGEVQLSQRSLGKIQVGQKVLIKFNSYPFQEFGLVRGKVVFITETPIKDSLFLAKISLPEGLITNSKKTIPFKNNLSAIAEVITQDKSLLERFFEKFKIR